SPLPARAGGLFLWHCPSGRPDWPLASTLPCGARTFLPRPIRGRDASDRLDASGGGTGSILRGRLFAAFELRLLHDLAPVDDASALRTGLDRVPALEQVEELRRDRHVASLAHALHDRDHRQAAPEPDGAVLLQHVGPDLRRDGVARAALTRGLG